MLDGKYRRDAEGAEKICTETQKAQGNISIKKHPIRRRRKSVSIWSAVLMDPRLPGDDDGVYRNNLFASIAPLL